MRQATQMEPTLLKLFAALLVLVPTAAFAENTVPFPDYPDPTPDCRRMATGINGNDRFFNNCIAEAQRDYNFAKAIWPRLTQQTAETCADRASASDVRGSPYSQWMALSACASSLYSLQPLPPQVFTK
jgi:hypothetical protein